MTEADALEGEPGRRPHRLRHGAGPVGDRHGLVEQLADAVAGVLTRPETQRRHSARRRAEQFTWPRSAEGMLDAMGVR